MYGEAPWEPRFDILDLQPVRKLGKGAFGEVILTRARLAGDTDGSCEHLFALKRSSLAQVSEAGLEHAQAEARLLQKLGGEHEAILQCFDYRLAPGAQPMLELLLEWAPLGDLGSLIRSYAEASPEGSTAGMPEMELVSLVCDVAAGLAHLHGASPKILHRDIKPANVVLFPVEAEADSSSTEPLGKRAKLADFGIAKVLEIDMSVAGCATVIGTPHYFSPEMCRGERYDERTDSWSFGCVIYEMVCLQRPFHKAEGNIAALAIKVMSANYDKELLESHAVHYHSLVIQTLAGLMALEPQSRLLASAALDLFQAVREELRGAPAKSAVSWWQMSSRDTDAFEGSVSEDVTDMSEDSWMDASVAQTQQDDATINPWQEAVATLRQVQAQIQSQAPTRTATPTAAPALPATALAAVACNPLPVAPAAARPPLVPAYPLQPGSMELSYTEEGTPSVGILGTMGPSFLDPADLGSASEECYKACEVSSAPDRRQSLKALPRPQTEYLAEAMANDTDRTNKDAPRIAWLGECEGQASMFPEPSLRDALDASDTQGISSTVPSGAYSGIATPQYQYLRPPLSSLGDEVFSSAADGPVWAVPRIFCRTLAHRHAGSGLAGAGSAAMPPLVPDRSSDKPVILYFAKSQLEAGQAAFDSQLEVSSAHGSACGIRQAPPRGWFEIDLSVVSP